MRNNVLGAVIVAALTLATPALPQQSAAARDCSGPEYRAFDFWLGGWNVGSDGQFAGTNDVTSAYGGCAISEHWQGADGGKGTSLSGYDRHSGQWQQLWIDDRGGVVRLAGGPQGDGMRLTSVAPDVDGRSHRVTWLPQPENRVQQVWESRGSEEQPWETVFVGVYERRGLRAAN